MTVTMQPVESSGIAAVGYDPATNDLHINWKSGSASVHHNVPPEKHAAFLASDSKGKFFHAQIRAQHPGERK